MWGLHDSAVGAGIRQWQLISGSGSELTFAEVLHGWSSSESFRQQWIAWLCKLPFDAYVWECPPVTSASVSRAFECVFVSSPSLARLPPDKDAFAEHFRTGCHAVTFVNLGGDAVLVAPCPADDARDFNHLGEFVRTASPVKQDALWQAVGDAMQARVSNDPTWLSTAGHGVAWLHVRLDTRPKYYRYTPYVSR